MNLGLTDDQQFFQETTRKFLEQEAPLTAVRALADDPDGFDRAWWARGAELGWTSFLVREDDGGGSLSGEGVVDLAIVAEEMGRLVSPGPLVPTNVVADAVARGGAAELRADVLPGIVAGEIVAAWCIAGPSGGWDEHGVAVGATRDASSSSEGVLVLDGVSMPVEYAAQADELLVTARSDGGLTQCLVPASAAGVHIEAIESVDLVRRFATVHLEGVRVTPDRVVGEVGGAAAAVGRQLASYQAIKHRIADMKMWIEGSHGVTEVAVQAVQDDDPEVIETVSAAASYLGDHAGEILQECTQLHGGIGVTWEHDLHLYLRRITLDRNLFGTPAQHRERIAEAIITKHGTAIDMEASGV